MAEAGVVRGVLEDAGHVAWKEIRGGHRIGETRSGFVILTSGDGKTLVRLRPGDDWVEVVEEKRSGESFESAVTAEYACTVFLLGAWSQALKNAGYKMGQRNQRTLVVMGWEGS